MDNTVGSEQDLARALDSVAGSLGSGARSSVPVVNSDSSVGLGATTISTSLPPTELPPVASPSLSDASILASPIAPSNTSTSSPLADIKKDALLELRPLVDKLSVSPEEKFDTYLLLIRSTDDINLIAPAHDAAKSIQDEARRAEALLNIIKEIDYLSQNK
ncbi:MAG: hypothetical protein WAW80_04155 [Candidatus Saccharimonadales bacterium]